LTRRHAPVRSLQATSPSTRSSPAPRSPLATRKATRPSATTSRAASWSAPRTIADEVGHILDWRDNGVIDWGENIPAL